jgi:succinoglycan biosynthesis transport protein ExoP
MNPLPATTVRPPHVVPTSFLRDATFGFVGLLKAVRKSWPIVAASVALALGASLLYTKSATKVYESKALVEIDAHAPQPLSGEHDRTMLEIGSGLMWDDHAYYETQYKIIASDRVLSAVARNLGLLNDPEFTDAASGGHPITVEQATAKLRGMLTIEPIKYSELLWVKVDGSHPAQARRITDAITDVYIEQNLQTALSSTSDAVVWLGGQLDHIRQDLEQNENALYDFKRRNDLPSTSINDASNMLRVEMQELDVALTHTRIRKEELAAREVELSKVSTDNPDQLPASELLASGYLQTLRTHYQDATKERLSLLADGKGENHPLMKRADGQVNETREALLAEVANIKGAVEKDLAIVTREEAGDLALFEATRQRAVALNMKEIEYHRLDRTRDENEKLYGALLQRMKESDLARMMRVNNIRVVDPATESHDPILPRSSVNLTLGLFFGIAVGIALAWGREQLDSSLKTPVELESELGVTFLGLLPEVDDTENDRKRRSRRRRQPVAKGEAAPIELVVHNRPLSGIAEAARSIRTNLLFMNPDRPYRTLLVTSAAPSEGKTTIACSIAIALAQGGQRVCIVDCDLRRPRLHRIFDRVGDKGVTNVLVGDATLDEAAKPTVVDNLWSIPAGPIPPNPADILHSEAFKRFLVDLAAKFDRVIIDSAPLVAVTDSAIISTQADATVFVVRAFKTSKHLSAQGLRVLRDVDAPIVGAVLNAVDLNRQEYSYYYHYYYYKQREGYASPGGSSDPGDAEGQGAAPPN